MDNQKQYSLLVEAFNAVYDNISESHFKVGDEVVCKKSGMEGEVVKLDKPDGKEDEKYYTVKREDGKKVKYAPNELKLAEEAKNGGAPKKKEEKFHTKLDKLVHSTFGSSPEERKMKEEFDIFDVILEHLVAEGYADTNQAALAIMANMSEEWKHSIIEMDEFAAGGGNAKMKKTGMTKDQVIALGKKNLTKTTKSFSTPTSQSQSPRSVIGSTKSDVVRDRLDSMERRRQNYTGRSPVDDARRREARDQEAKYNEWEKKQNQSGYYKSGYHGLAG
jgi:hypothetical protein